MAGHARYTALLDACVLYSAAMTDALMSLATAGLFAAKWSRAIEIEWISALEKNRPDLQGKLSSRRDLMREVIPDWEVPDAAWQAIEVSVTLPDANDRHVIAAALAGHVDSIVTVNVRDFPATELAAIGLEVIHPDTFIVAQWDLDPLVAAAAFKRMRARWKKPQASALDFASALERNGLPMTAHRLREASELI